MDSVKLEYNLTREEIKTSLLLAERIKDRMKSNWIKTILLVFLSVVFALQYFFVDQPNYTFGVVLILLCYALIAVIWIMPQREDKSIIENALDHNDYLVTITVDKIIADDKNGEVKEILLNKESELINKRLLFLIFTAEGGLLIIPHRTIKDENLEIVTEWLTNGTIPR